MIVDEASWSPIGVNHGGPRTARTLGVALHIAVAEWSTAQARAFFGTSHPDNPVSCHFFVARTPDGETFAPWVQLLDTDVTSYCQADGNANYLSIETAGTDDDDEWDDGQLNTIAALCAATASEYGYQIRAATAPGQEGLIPHAAGGADWGGHPCPLPHRIAQIPEIARRAQTILDGGQLSSDPLQEADMTPEEHRMLSDLHSMMNAFKSGPEVDVYKPFFISTDVAGTTAVLRSEGISSGVAWLVAHAGQDADPAELAKALAPLLPSLVAQLDDDDYRAIAKAVADEEAKRMVA